MQPAANLALSTCWASKHADSAVAILDAIEPTGIYNLELEYRLTAPILADLLPQLCPRGFKVVSVHNFCPLPPDYPADMASGDLFNFASSDPEERARVVEYTAKTMELASDLEAGAVVLHLGLTDMEPDRLITKQAADQGAITPELDSALELRAKLSPGVLDAVSFALERLIPRAQSLGVTLGLENRIRVHQAPTLDELDFILRRFEGAPLAPWLDIGHAQVKANAGLRPFQEWLDRMRNRLLGCHLHDIKASKDHELPGLGDVDWPEMMRALKDVPIKVLELHPGPGAEEIRESLQLLKQA
jgi:sugar phosphate isomerase/epimerase